MGIEVTTWPNIVFNLFYEHILVGKLYGNTAIGGLMS